MNYYKIMMLGAGVLRKLEGMAVPGSSVGACSCYTDSQFSHTL